MTLIKRFVKEESGQGLIEYALIAALIAIVAIVALQQVGQTMRASLEASAAALAN